MIRVASAFATVPQPCRLLGTTLRPFCLGHHLLLKRLGSPLAGDAEAACERADLLVAIAVCATDYETTLNELLDDSWATVFAQWRRDVTGHWWQFWRRKHDLVRVERKFRRYLKDGYEEPPVNKHVGGSTVALTAPWELRLKCTLTRAGFSESEALNGYLPARWYDYFTVLELMQVETLEDPKRWRPVFTTARDAALIEEANA